MFQSRDEDDFLEIDLLVRDSDRNLTGTPVPITQHIYFFHKAKLRFPESEFYRMPTRRRLEYLAIVESDIEYQNKKLKSM